MRETGMLTNHLRGSAICLYTAVGNKCVLTAVRTAAKASALTKKFAKMNTPSSLGTDTHKLMASSTSVLHVLRAHRV